MPRFGATSIRWLPVGCGSLVRCLLEAVFLDSTFLCLAGCYRPHVRIGWWSLIGWRWLAPCFLCRCHCFATGCSPHVTRAGTGLSRSRTRPPCGGSCGGAPELASDFGPPANARREISNNSVSPSITGPPKSRRTIACNSRNRAIVSASTSKLS